MCDGCSSGASYDVFTFGQINDGVGGYDEEGISASVVVDVVAGDG